MKAARKNAPLEMLLVRSALAGAAVAGQPIGVGRRAVIGRFSGQTWRTATSVFGQKTAAAGDIAAILIDTLVGVDGWDIALPGLRQLAPLGKEYLGCQALAAHRPALIRSRQSSPARELSIPVKNEVRTNRTGSQPTQPD
jgi:hypothetical protein